MNKIPVILTMIVKNEEHIINRSLDSTLPYVDALAIIDTGSTDNTFNKVIEICKVHNKIFMLEQKDFVDFSTNRNQSIELAESLLKQYFPGQQGYLYVHDADDKFVSNVDFPFANVDGKHGYKIKYDHDGSIYSRTQMFPAFMGIRYHGEVHENLDFTLLPSSQYIELTDCYVDFKHLGARSKDPFRYYKDSLLLEKAVKNNPNDTHSLYFLASCYKDDYGIRGDIDQKSKSVEVWKRLIDHPNAWNTQKWFACLQVAFMSIGEQYYYFLKALEFDPGRVEPLYYLAKSCRESGMNQSAYIFAKRASEFPNTESNFFMDSSIYEWKILDELSIAAYYCNKFEESLRLCDLLLTKNIPDGDKIRIVGNRNFSVMRLKG
jgi:hypothetical protein